MIDIVVTVLYLAAIVFFVYGIVVEWKWYRVARKVDKEIDGMKKEGDRNGVLEVQSNR